MVRDTATDSAQAAAGWILLAILAHLSLLFLVPSVPEQRVTAQELAELSINIIEDVIAEPIEESEEITEEVTEVAPPPEDKTPKPPPEPVEPKEEPPAAADETPLAFDNVTLTNKGSGSDWAIMDSSGIERDGPMGRPDAVVTGGSRLGKAGGVIGGSGKGVVMDMGDLSRQPRPPNLKHKLKRNYPKPAKAGSLEGEANIRLQINRDGSTSGYRTISEDPKGYGFSQACIKTLRGERWEAPVDDSGNRVATRVNYTCRFTFRK